MKTIRIEAVNGMLIFATLGIYFLVLDALGYADVMFLRFFNAVIVGFFINRTIKINVSRGKVDYLENLGSAVLTAVFGVFLSVLGLWFYIGAVQGVGASG